MTLQTWYFHKKLVPGAYEEHLRCFTTDSKTFYANSTHVNLAITHILILVILCIVANVSRVNEQ